MLTCLAMIKIKHAVVIITDHLTMFTCVAILSIKQLTTFFVFPYSDGRYPRPVSRLSFRSKVRGGLFDTGRVDTQELLGDLDDSGRCF